MDLHTLISNFSYIAIFFLMIANGAVNFPSSQFLYIICGYFISTSSLLFLPTIIVGAIGNTIGNTITFLLIKKYDRSLAHKLLMLDETTFKKIHSTLHETFSRRGLWYVFIGKLIPSIKAFIPIVAGLAYTETKRTVFIFLISSFIWATGVTSIGYYFGEHINLRSISTVSLIIGSVILFLIYREYSKKSKQKNI